MIRRYSRTSRRKAASPTSAENLIRGDVFPPGRKQGEHSRGPAAAAGAFPGCGYNAKVSIRRRNLRLALAVLVVIALTSGSTCFAQVIPKQPPTPLSKLVPPSGSGVCAVGKSCAEVAPVIIESALGASPLEENLRYLTDSIGGRVTGSATADRAVGWAVEAFRHTGVDEVLTEQFTVPVGWAEGPTRVEVLSPEPFRVRLVATGWSPPTPEGGITADVVDVGAGDAAGFAKAGAAAKNAIVLVHSNLLVTWDDLSNEYKFQPGIIDRAARAGADAIFWMS